MPLCALHLLSLNVSIRQFLAGLSSTSLKPLTIARVIRWIILPTTTSTDKLLAQNIHWDLLLILPNTDTLPPHLQKLVAQQWSIQAGVPSRLLHDFATKNKRMLHPHPGDVPSLTGSLNNPRISSSSQSLALSPALQTWIRSFSTTEAGSGAVSMLNLLSIFPEKKDSYMKYGAEFARSIGSRRGGNAKIVGSVIHGEKGQKMQRDGMRSLWRIIPV